MTYKIRIGSLTDYIEFGVSNPTPVFAPQYSFAHGKNVSSGGDTVIKKVVQLDLTDCIFLGSTFTELVRQLDQTEVDANGVTSLVDFLMDGPKDFRFYDDTTLVYSLLTDNYDMSPRYENIAVEPVEGSFRNFIKVKMAVIAESGTAAYGLDVYDVSWMETEIIENGMKRRELRLQAKGDGAEDWVKDNALTNADNITYTHDKINQVHTAAYLISEPSGGGGGGSGIGGATNALTLTESIRISGGGNPLTYLTASGQKPTKFVGQEQPVEVSFSGDVRAIKESDLVYPIRNFPEFENGKVQFDKVIEETKPNGTPAIWKGSWQQTLLMTYQDYLNNKSSFGLVYKNKSGVSWKAID